uniref:Uncharacterized protein n=1 Tax=Meloidogyne enterolobii TaxID=390850 RepID=A0A6V7VQP0_MELEN|nr:unnamed protein product [Meloidogyne enterolobii]
MNTSNRMMRGLIFCRAAKRCYVHTLDKLYKHGDKIGQELDDSLGVEKSGRVPSGKYNMHIDLFVILYT